MTLKNFFRGLAYQLRNKGWFRNFFVTRNAWGLFSKWSHLNKSGNLKVMYSKEESAVRAAEQMAARALKKEGKVVHYSVYKCVHCDGFHIGRNRDNK